MSIGERLINLRKSKNLSQEQVADQINVTRQTISKWETDQSVPDLDKVIPLCELYGISADELLSGNIKEEMETSDSYNYSNMRKKKSLGIGLGIFLYFVAIAWIMIAIPVMLLNPIVASAIFLLICGVATFVIVYTCINYKTPKVEVYKEENKVAKSIKEIAAIITTIIYFTISFLTYAWHITWIIWIAYGLIDEIINLIFLLKEDKHEK